jgi:RimJ/RimL family protein N-acetyltransferase
MYFEKYKVDMQIFEGIPTIDMGGTVLRGIFPNLVETEAKAYLLNSKESLVKKFLPGAYVETEEQALDKLHDYVQRYLLRASILFCVATKEKQIPVGYVLCNSPVMTYQNSNRIINDWTIDFWLAERARGRGIMIAAAYNALVYLNKMKVPGVYAFTDKENAKSINILIKCGMTLIEETADKKMYKYGVTF